MVVIELTVFVIMLALDLAFLALKVHQLQMLDHVILLLVGKIVTVIAVNWIYLIEVEIGSLLLREERMLLLLLHLLLLMLLLLFLGKEVCSVCRHYVSVLLIL